MQHPVSGLQLGCRQAGGCVHGMVLSCYAPPSRVPEEPPDLSAWRQNEKEEGGTGVTPVLKGILQEISDDDSEVL